MCENCYIDYGSPQIDNERVRVAAQKIGFVYGHNPLGGNLHIMLDDWNLGTDDLDWYAQNIEDNPWKGTPEQQKAERECLEAMGGLSEEEQASALGLHWGMWA